MMVQTTLFGEILPELEEEGEIHECDIRCLRAKGDRCVCRCGGRNHGILHKRALGESLNIYLGCFEEIKQIFDGHVCPSCGTPFNGEIFGYPHAGGLEVKKYGMKLWVFARCQKCGYETAWWKVGRSLHTEKEAWP